jgi:hypothetical protein
MMVMIEAIVVVGVVVGVVRVDLLHAEALACQDVISVRDDATGDAGERAGRPYRRGRMFGKGVRQRRHEHVAGDTPERVEMNVAHPPPSSPVDPSHNASAPTWFVEAVRKAPDRRYKISCFQVITLRYHKDIDCPATRTMDDGDAWNAADTQRTNSLE